MKTDLFKVYFCCLINLVYLRLRTSARNFIYRKQSNKHVFVNFSDKDFDTNGLLKCILDSHQGFINEINIRNKVSRDMVFPVENLITNQSLSRFFSKSFCKKCKTKLIFCNDQQKAVQYWSEFIIKSAIPAGYKYAGLSYAGYIHEVQEWCLPSWIWINAAVVRYFCTVGDLDNALRIGKILIKLQIANKGWIVRNDYGDSIKPLLAPNDSAYIANNACLNIYKMTKKKEYLDSAISCADWIISTARSDGLVYFGYDTFKKKWETDRNIVDIGFTTALFIELFRITGNKKYIDFANSFSQSFLHIYYNQNKHFFWSSIGANDIPSGTGFSRGQAWALEGLIPLYNLLKEKYLKEIISKVVNTLIKKQNKDGSWPRELEKPGLGSDCKGTPVIAYSLYNWANIADIDAETKHRILSSVKKALSWCISHTATIGTETGGIFSYSFEGAIVHHHNSSTAFVYSSAYALELHHLINNTGS